MSEDLKKLFEKAKEASINAYAPYSGFKVGAAIKTKNNKIFTGCNVENASYSLGLCAERNAIHKAISENEREFVALAIYVDSDKLFPPCGACRQVIIEFSDTIDIIYGNNHETHISNIKNLLPESFRL